MVQPQAALLFLGVMAIYTLGNEHGANFFLKKLDWIGFGGVDALSRKSR
jgi:hypothetical protein